MPVIGGGPGGGGGNNAGGGHSTFFIPYTMIFQFTLKDFPEWAIPYTKVIPRCYIDDGHDPESLRLTLQCQHLWIVSANQDAFGNSLGNSITLQVMIYAEVDDFDISGPSQVIPTYIDVDLVFFNERNYKELNNNKS